MGGWWVGAWDAWVGLVADMGRCTSSRTTTSSTTTTSTIGYENVAGTFRVNETKVVSLRGGSGIFLGGVRRVKKTNKLNYFLLNLFNLKN